MLTKQALEYLRLGTGGSYSLARDAITHRIWDTRLIAATISDYTYFSQPVGSAWRQAGTFKTLTETNIYDTGKLPNGQTFLVNRIGICCLIPLTAAVITTESLTRAFNNLLCSSVFEIRLAGREYDFQAHGRHFLPMPLFNVGVSTANSLRIGDMIAAGWLKLDPTPIFLDQLVTFSVIQRLANPDTNVTTILNADATLLNAAYGTIMVVLEGFLTRAK